MALPSFAPENVKAAPPSALARVFARINSVLAERHDSRREAGRLLELFEAAIDGAAPCAPARR